VLDLYQELMELTRELTRRNIDYAVCGGVAMAVHGFPRATVDIDILIREADLQAVESIAELLGYRFRARPMSFAGGMIEIRRISKIDPETLEPFMLDLMLVTPQLEDVWATREVADMEGGEPLGVVSREGLIKLKSSRMSGTDIDDISKLRSNE
jgi:hypothetical protein